MTYERLPDELKLLVQWVVWKKELTESGKYTKIPHNPITGHKANVTDPQTWCTFEQAVNAVQTNSAYAGIGFVFTERDPYCGIDLDKPSDAETFNRQQEIYHSIPSYAEFSPSGEGLHIICRGSVEAGRKRNDIEVYSTGRFFTMTGNVYREAPIVWAQEQVLELWESLAGSSGVDNGFVGSLERLETDDEVYQRAANASNGQKFIDLWSGNWRDYYSSQSEADYALVDILAYYTDNKMQVLDLFRASELGKRDKAQRDDYCFKMIDRAYDNRPPAMDMDAFLANYTAQKETPADQENDGGATESQKESSPTPMNVEPRPSPVNPKMRKAPDGVSSDEISNVADVQTVPELDFDPAFHVKTPLPGIMGQIEDFLYQASPRPVRIAAKMGAIGFMAGLVGRQFNISNTGLNQYLAFVAPTGRGKEALNAGIDRLISRMQSEILSIKSIRGPSNISSGQALSKHIGDKTMHPTPCFLSIFSEFGLRLGQMTGEKANYADLELKRQFLDLYSKSGKSSVMGVRIYADKANNTEEVKAPAVSFLAETTPGSFYENLTEAAIASGFLPRWVVCEYNGKRPPMNYGHADAEVSPALVENLKTLAHDVAMLANRDQFIDVVETPEASEYLHAINVYCDGIINNNTQDTVGELFNRVHLKVYRLAGLLAVALNHRQPVVDAMMVKWALSLVMTDTMRMYEKATGGKLGKPAESTERRLEIMKALQKYVDQSVKIRQGEEKFRDKGMIRRSCLTALVQPHNRKAFKGAPGYGRLFEDELRSFVNEEILRPLSPGELTAAGFDATAKNVYAIMDLEKIRSAS